MAPMRHRPSLAPPRPTRHNAALFLSGSPERIRGTATLLRGAAASVGRVLALSYPNGRWYIRLIFAVDNLRRRMTGNPFRAFVHPPKAIRQQLEAAGLRRAEQRSTFIWKV